MTGTKVVSNPKTQAHYLTEKQESAGYYLREDDHLVYLYCKEQQVAVFNAYHVTIEELRKAADTHMNGISFVKV